MVLYYSREYHAASIGVRIVEVTCEKCSALYFYELARVGKGHSSAPYALGSDSAAKASTEKASKNLEKRLDKEAELVPCPKCAWINDDLVAGYRHGRYRGWTKFALGVASIGTFVSLVMAWFISIGPGADRAALWVFLFVGPAISLGLGAILYAIRTWLRSLIQPNRDFPHPPKLPPGSPKSLVKNPTTGELEAAPPLPGHETSGDGWIDYQIGRIILPSACSACLGSSDPRSAYQRPLDQAVTLSVPRCAACAKAASSTVNRRGLISLAIVSLPTLPILWFSNIDPIFLWCGVVLIPIFGYILGIALGDGATRPVQVKFVDSSRGIIRLRFRNQDYREQAELLTYRSS